MDYASALRDLFSSKSAPDPGYAGPLRQMIDPLAGKRSVGEMPSTQSAVKEIGKSIAEPFGQLGRVMTGQSQEPWQDIGSAMLQTAAPEMKAGTLATMLAGPLYHGSERLGLNVLKESVRGPLGPGVYTSPAEGVAGHYAGGAGKIYNLPEKPRDVFLGHGHRTDDEWFGFKNDKQRLIDAAEPDKREAVAKILEPMWSNDGYPAYQRLMHLYKGDEGAQNLFKKAGFHGVSGLVDGPEVLLFGEQSLRK